MELESLLKGFLCFRGRRWWLRPLETCDITDRVPTADLLKIALTKFAGGSDVRQEIGIKGFG